MGPLVHITGSLGVDGQNWTQCSTGPTSFDFIGPNMQSASLLSRSVLSAGTSFDIASVQMTPKVDGHGETAPNSTGQPTQGGGVRFSLGNDGFPIILAAPYPFGLPQMGDDTNKFVYDGSFSGVLSLPMSAVAVGAAQVDAQWLVDTNQVDWAINPAIDGLQSYTKQAQGASIYPVTNGAGGVTMYEGLPDSEQGFGYKELALKVQGNNSQKAYIQIFFPATAQNHPNIFAYPTPNWFYYYNKISPASPAVYEDIPISKCYSDSTSDPEPYHFPKVTGVSIGNDAYQTDAIRVFVPTSTTLKYDGILYINGIHTYIYTVGHELGHKWDIENGLVNRKFRNSDAWNQGFDYDGDGVLNSAEEANGLDPEKRDTTDAFGGDINGDVEVLACIHGLDYLLPNKDAWKRDWSDAGLQFLGLFDQFWGPHNPDPTFSIYWGSTLQPYFPWDYNPWVMINGQPYTTDIHNTDPPGNAVTQVKNPFSVPPYTDGKIPYPGRHIP